MIYKHILLSMQPFSVSSGHQNPRQPALVPADTQRAYGQYTKEKNRHKNSLQVDEGRRGVRAVHLPLMREVPAGHVIVWVENPFIPLLPFRQV